MLNLNFKFLHLIIHFPGCLFQLETPNSFQQDLPQYSFTFGKTELWKDRTLEKPSFGKTELWKDRALERPNFGKTELWKDRTLERQNFGHIELCNDKLSNFSTCERSSLGKTKAQQRGIHLSATLFGLGSLQLFSELLRQVYLG